MLANYYTSPRVLCAAAAPCTLRGRELLRELLQNVAEKPEEHDENQYGADASTTELLGTVAGRGNA
jgi:hypothetical protein